MLNKYIVRQFTKFAGVGIVAFCIDYGVMVFLTEVFGIDYLISTTVGFVVSVIFNYFASMRYVFVHKEGFTRRKEFIIFTALAIVGLGLNDLLMWVLVGSVDIDYRIAKIAVTAMVTMYNFITRKIFLDAS